jgi:hypothetical protein
VSIGKVIAIDSGGAQFVLSPLCFEFLQLHISVHFVCMCWIRVDMCGNINDPLFTKTAAADT